jgi:hypothetical protein
MNHQDFKNYAEQEIFKSVQSLDQLKIDLKKDDFSWNQSHLYGLGAVIGMIASFLVDYPMHGSKRNKELFKDMMVQYELFCDLIQMALDKESNIHREAKDCIIDSINHWMSIQSTMHLNITKK